MRRALLWSLPLAVVIMAACQADNPARDQHESSTGGGDSTGGADGSSTGNDGTSTGSTAATTGGTGNTGGGATGNDTDVSTGGFKTLACDTPAIGSPVLRLLTRTEFDQTIADIFPSIQGQWTDSLPSSPSSSYGFDNATYTVVGPPMASALLDTALSIATAITGNALNGMLPCAASSANHACAETFVNQYGRRLFRRPLTQADHDRFLGFFDTSLTASDFKTALKWTIVGLIQSPNAVYRSEIGTDNGDGTRSLSPYELATEMSYAYTGSTPTDALLTQADSGNLGDLKALAKTLLTSDKGKASMQHFFDEYLDYSRVTSIEKTSIPTFDSVRADMVKETQTFIDNVVFQQNGGLDELLTAPTTFPSKNLASYYGFTPPGTDYGSVTRPTGRGIGILAQGSVLASRALPNSSSPTQRGLLVFQRLLCQVKPQVPNNVPLISDPVPGQVTTRQRYEILHVGGGDGGATVCATCHKRFDPIGFGFEHFDEGGNYRETEDGLTIDSASYVPNSAGDPIFQFAGQETLAQGLAAQPTTYQCFAQYLSTYAFGTGDSCLGMSNVDGFAQGTVGIVDYYAGLAGERHFSTRATPAQ